MTNPEIRPFTEAEAAVLRLVIDGRRTFSGFREIMALARLRRRDYLTFEFVKGEQIRTRKYSFGRRIIYDRIPDNHVRVSAPRIETAIERHGKAAVLRSVTAQGICPRVRAQQRGLAAASEMVEETSSSMQP